MRVLATQSIRHFFLHFPYRASPCAIRCQTRSTQKKTVNCGSEGARSRDLLYDIQTVLVEELENTVRKYSAGVELNVERTGELLQQDCVDKQEW